MARLDQLLAEADDLINKRMSGGVEKTAASNEEDDIFKLAAEVRTPSTPALEDTSAIDTLTEKVAHALAITEVLMNLPVLVQLQSFEKTARARGYSEDQIFAQMEKVAGKEGKLRSVLKLLPWIGGSAVVAGGAGKITGEHKGEQKGVAKGYVQALKDVNDAWEGYKEP